MEPTKPIIERAFELARAGSCRSVNDIRQTLRREGYEGVHAHLHGTTINRQITALIKAAGMPAAPLADESEAAPAG